MAYDLKRLFARLQTNRSPKIDTVELAKLVLKAGWTGEDAVNAVATAGAESGYKIKAKNVDKRHGGEDYGLFQISEIHDPTEKQKYDPEENTKLAYKIWKRRHDRGEDGFLAWMAYRDRAVTAQKNVNWTVFTNEARRAVEEAQRQLANPP